MKATIARVVLGAVVAAVIPTIALPASAGSDEIHGGCFFDTDQPPNATTQTGVIGDLSATTSGISVRIGAVVSCKIQVNGVDAPGTTFSYSGFGVQAGANPISYTATDLDYVGDCERVVYEDGVDTGWDCNSTTITLPPGEFMPIEFVLEVLHDVFVYSVDPQVCPVLAAHAGTYGPVTISPDGDVDAPDPLDLWNDPMYDCPPYGSF
jgi:hypothetical protein